MEISTIIIDTETFLVFKGVEYLQIPVSQIISIQVEAQKYLVIETTLGNYRVLTSLASIAKYLTNFIKVSKGLIINRYYLIKLVKCANNKDNYHLVMSNGRKESYIIEVSAYIARNVIAQL